MPSRHTALLMAVCSSHSAAKSGRSFKLAMTHNGLTGRASDEFENYAAEMVDFVQFRNIDRLFVELMDPTQFSYAKPELVASQLLDKLPAHQEVCAFLYLRPKDADWAYNPKAPGGFCHDGTPSTVVSSGTCPKSDTDFPPGCPNYAEQAAQYLADVNSKSRSAKITCMSFDGEDVGMYGSPEGMCQIGYAMSQVGITDFGMAKGAGVTPKSTGGTSGYPEMYWIGELAADDCHGIKADASKCVNTIYTRNKNNPQGMLDAFAPYLDPYRQSFTQDGTWPMFSIEYMDKPGESTCIQRHYRSDGICGTFNGFGTWDWEPFEQFLELFAQKYGVATVAVYEWQFVPDAWKRTSPSPTPPSPSPPSPSSCASADVTCSSDSDCTSWVSDPAHGCPHGAYGYCKDNGHCVIKVPELHVV